MSPFTIEPRFERGVFTISIDFELIWGTLDKHGPDGFARICAIERAEVVDGLLNLFREFDISASWCAVGKLFLDGEENAPLFHARSLIRRILACRPEQEIGCHTFSHAILGSPTCTSAIAAQEVDASIDAARSLGIEMRTFVFPRNRVAHLDVLRSRGFTVFRGPEPRWWTSSSYPRAARRFGQLLDIATIHRPPVVFPKLDDSGLWNIPGSMLFTPAYGMRRYVPMWFRVSRARKGLDAAVRERGIFHLWFHPTDLAPKAGPMLAGLRRVLEYSSELRERGLLEVFPMGTLAAAAKPQAVSA